jgi:iron complex outermembrane receptor protein
MFLVPSTSFLLRPAIAALLVAVAPCCVLAQVPEHEGEIEGLVRDAETGVPLAGTTVTLIGGRNAAITHADGSFHMVRVAPGTHSIRVERLGYASANVSVEVGTESAFVIITLESSAIDIGGLVVTGALTERGADEVLRPVSVMSGQELQRRLQGTVAATLTSEPGLSATTMGPATARPVVRGMSGDRVLMLEDGARVGDVSGSGSDHATALDPSSARRIEVVRGPAALLYGSNALGGVINVIRDEVPSSVPHHFTGSATAQTQTVSDAFSGSSSVRMRLSDHVPLRLEVTGRTSDDLATPAGPLQNTRADTWSAGAGSAYVSDWGHVGGAFRVYNNSYGIPGGFVGGHAAGVRVEMERTSSKLRAEVLDPFGPFESVSLDGTYTWYRHREIEPPDILGTAFELQTLSGDVLARHGALGPLSAGAIGVRTSWEDFGFGGSLFTPDARRYTGAAYVFEEIHLDPVRLEAGLRYDWVRADPLQEDPMSTIGAIRDRTFQAASGSLGLLYNVGGGVTLGASVARAFRTPDINELYSEGPHLAAYSFEVGNPALGTEVGTGVDVVVRFGSERAHAEVTGFYNDITGYVYGEETGEISRVQLPIYQFQGRDALLKGFEGGFDVRIVGDLVLDGTASYVHGTLKESDRPLPLIPPFHGRLGLEYDRPGWFVGGEAEVAAEQDRIGEFETTTAGYSVFHASGGVRVTLGGRLNVVTVSVDNLTDEQYRNHLSRVKEIMPEAGRGVSVTYRVVF